MGWKDMTTSNVSSIFIQNYLMHKICNGNYTESELKEFLCWLSKFYAENPDPESEINATVMVTLISVLLENDHRTMSTTDQSKEAISLIMKILSFAPNAIAIAWVPKRYLLPPVRESIEKQLNSCAINSIRYEQLERLRRRVVELEEILGIYQHIPNFPETVQEMPKLHGKPSSIPPKSTPECNTCFNSESPHLKLKHLSCKHMYCNRCLARNARYALSRNSSRVICPRDGIQIKEEEIFGVLKEDEKAAYKKIARFESKLGPLTDADFLTTCPKCRNSTFAQADAFGLPGKLGECMLCVYAFCCQCRKDFHGESECVNGISDIVNKLGACSLQHQQDVYKSNLNGWTMNSGAIDYSVEQISSAFGINKLTRAREADYPWNWAGFNRFEMYPPRYEYLKDGNWVTDDILEDSMKILANGSESSISILESYAINWAAKRNYEIGNLVDLVMGKNFMCQSTVAALVNTDVKGSGGHWTLGLICMLQKQIIIFDTSIVYSPTYYEKYFFYLLHILHIAYQLENLDFNPNDWKLIVSLDSIQQTNSNDCGPLVVANLYGIINGKQLNTLPNGSKLRKWIFNVIASNGSKLAFPSNNQGLQKMNMNIVPFNPMGLDYCYAKTEGIIYTYNLTS